MYGDSRNVKVIIDSTKSSVLLLYSLFEDRLDLIEVSGYLMCQNLEEKLLMW